MKIIFCKKFTIISLKSRNIVNFFLPDFVLYWFKNLNAHIIYVWKVYKCYIT